MSVTFRTISYLVMISIFCPKTRYQESRILRNSSPFSWLNVTVGLPESHKIYFWIIPSTGWIHLLYYFPSLVYKLFHLSWHGTRRSTVPLLRYVLGFLPTLNSTPFYCWKEVLDPLTSSSYKKLFFLFIQLKSILTKLKDRFMT